jgi:hypothetical protein
MMRGNFLSEATTAIDQALARSIAPAMEGVVVRALPTAAPISGKSLVRAPVGWILCQVILGVRSSGRLETTFVFHPLVSPLGASFGVDGPAFNHAAAAADASQDILLRSGVAARVVEALKDGWPPQIARLGTLAGFAEHAVPMADDPDRDVTPELVLVAASVHALEGRMTDARQTLSELIDAAGGSEPVVFYATQLRRVLGDPSSARGQILQWRLQRISQLGISDIATDPDDV